MNNNLQYFHSQKLHIFMNNQQVYNEKKILIVDQKITSHLPLVLGQTVVGRHVPRLLLDKLI